MDPGEGLRMEVASHRASLLLAVVLVLGMSLSIVVSAPPVRAAHDTVSWSDPLLVAESPGFSTGYSRVVSDGQGNVYVFYNTINTATLTVNLNVTKYALTGPGGTPAQVFDTQVNDVPDAVQDLPFGVTTDLSGNLYVAWARWTTALAREVYVSKSSNGGVTWQAAVLANAPNAAGDDWWPSITETPDGTVWVAWYQSWGSATSVSLSKSTNDGGSFGSWTNVTSVSNLWYPVFASDAGGRLYLVYNTYAYDVSTSWSDDGVTWSPWKNLTTATFRGTMPAIYVDSSRVVHVAWSGLYGSEYEITYSQSQNRGVDWTSPVAITAPTGPGYIGYMAGEGDTVAFVWGTFSNSFGYAYSGDHGSTWYPDYTVAQPESTPAYVAADRNGTLWVSYDATDNLYVRWWNGPPSAPIMTGVAPTGTNGLTVSWTPSPEKNVAAYQVWRSSDGSTYQVVATMSASAASFTDTGLSNGAYWYKVTAVNVYGTDSHDSAAMSGVVGPTTAQLIASLQAQIDALEAQLADANASSAAALADAQTQISALQAQLTSLQDSQSAGDAATQAQIASLQSNLTRLQATLDSLKAAQTQPATLDTSGLLTVLVLAVLVVQAVMLVLQLRRPRRPEPPKRPEDEL